MLGFLAERVEGEEKEEECVAVPGEGLVPLAGVKVRVRARARIRVRVRVRARTRIRVRVRVRVRSASCGPWPGRPARPWRTRRGRC